MCRVRFAGDRAIGILIGQGNLMSWERDGQGNFQGGLINGASSAEQHSAGVTPYDSLTSAYEKVEAARSSSNAGSGATYAQSYGPTAGSGQQYYEPGSSGGSEFSFLGFFKVLMLGLILFVTYLVYDGTSEKVQPYRVGLSIGYPGGTMNAEALKTMRNTKSLEFLYVEGTKVEDIWKKCKVKNCWMPDIKAFDAFKQFAKNPASYEHQICVEFGHIANTSSVKPVWMFDRKNVDCLQTNINEVRKSVESHNRWSMLFSAIVFIAGMIFLVKATKSRK